MKEDFIEMIEVLNNHNVKYVIVGGQAVILHGYNRFTGDIDFFIEGKSENIENLCAALADYFSTSIQSIRNNENVQEFIKNKEMVLLFGNEPNEVDFSRNISGVNFTDVYKNKDTFIIDGLEIPIISFEDLVKNKKSTRRDKDQLDVKYLEKIKKH